jgi:hypothetical protein
MRAPITVKRATLEPITPLMNWRPEAKKSPLAQRITPQ